jgi:hypothetical protein
LSCKSIIIHGGGLQLPGGCNVITVFVPLYSGPDSVRGFFLPAVVPKAFGTKAAVPLYPRQLAGIKNVKMKVIIEIE